MSKQMLTAIMIFVIVAIMVDSRQLAATFVIGAAAFFAMFLVGALIEWVEKMKGVDDENKS